MRARGSNRCLLCGRASERASAAGFGSNGIWPDLATTLISRNISVGRVGGGGRRHIAAKSSRKERATGERERARAALVARVRYLSFSSSSRVECGKCASALWPTAEQRPVDCFCRPIACSHTYGRSRRRALALSWQIIKSKQIPHSLARSPARSLACPHLGGRRVIKLAHE